MNHNQLMDWKKKKPSKLTLSYEKDCHRKNINKTKAFFF